MQQRKFGQLAAVGSVGNASHASLPVPADADALALEVEITAVGATPTVTWKFQGSEDDPNVTDSNSDWFDLSVLPGDAAAEAASQTKTAVGVYESFVEMARRPIKKVRLVTSANTNVTYEGEAFELVDA